MTCIPKRASNVKASKEDLEDNLEKAKAVKESLVEKKKLGAKRSQNIATRIPLNTSQTQREQVPNSTLAFPLKPSRKEVIELVYGTTNLIKYETRTFNEEDFLEIVHCLDKPKFIAFKFEGTRNSSTGYFWEETDSFYFNNKEYYLGIYTSLGLQNKDIDGDGLPPVSRTSPEDDGYISLLFYISENGRPELGKLILFDTFTASRESEYFKFLPNNIINDSLIAVEYFLGTKDDFGNISSVKPIGYPNRSAGFTYSHIDGGAESVGLPEPITPKLASSSSYAVNLNQPYGPIWKKTLPGGYPNTAPKCSSKAGAKNLIDKSCDRVLDTLLVPGKFPQVNDIMNIREEFKTTFYHMSLIESAGILYAPQSKFDIRPKKGSSFNIRENLLDTGPRPRKGTYTISSTHRPSDKTYYSACGLVQYTRDTFRELYRKWKNTYNSTEIYSWIWDAPPEWQVLLQGSELIENIYNETTPDKIGGLQYPAIWRAIACYLKNAQNSPADGFIRETVAKINVQRAIEPNLSSVKLHIICRDVWESARLVQNNWYYTSTKLNRDHIAQKYSIGKKMALNPNSLPRKFPNIYESASNLLPKKR